MRPKNSGAFYKEIFMKKSVALFICLVLASLFLCACQMKEVTVISENDEFVVLTFDKGFSGETLKDAMENAQENEQITFTVENGMVTSINGIKQTSDTYWMLYTDDEEFSNTAWGIITYNEKEYASASKGITELIVKDGKTYIWVYTKF